jgi:hypothetical protein
MIGPNSPTALAASTWRPKGVASSPPSRRIGSSVPTAVVVSATATYHGASVIPAACNVAPAATASKTESNQPVAARLSGRPRIAPKSISILA